MLRPRESASIVMRYLLSICGAIGTELGICKKSVGIGLTLCYLRLDYWVLLRAALSYCSMVALCSCAVVLAILSFRSFDWLDTDVGGRWRLAGFDGSDPAMILNIG